MGPHETKRGLSQIAERLNRWLFGAELPEIAALPREVQWSARVAALSKLRKRSFLLRFLPEICAFIGISVGFIVMLAFMPETLMAQQGQHDAGVFQRLLLWEYGCWLGGMVIGARLGIHFRTRFLRQKAREVIDECVRKLQPNTDPA